MITLLLLLTASLGYIGYTTIRISLVTDIPHLTKHLILEYKKPNDPVFFSYIILYSFTVEEDDEMI